jgi:short-subunit dehydrogenase
MDIITGGSSGVDKKLAQRRKKKEALIARDEKKLMFLVGETPTRK